MFGLVGEEDLNIGNGTFSVTLPDGSVVPTYHKIGSQTLFDGILNALQNGCVGDGITNDTVAVQALLDASVGGVAYFPPGTYSIAEITVPSNILIVGSGMGRAILKARNGAGLQAFVHIPYASSNVILRDITIDGNRAGGGMDGTFSGAVFIEGSRVSLDTVEVKGGSWSGVFIGSASGIARHTNIYDSWIHDNGGVVNSSGNGIGILSGGLGSGIVTPQHITVRGCLIESNYNTVTRPNDSSGINLTVKHVKIIDNDLIDNFNVTGGQVVLWAAPDQTGVLDAVVTGNDIVSTTTFGTPVDRTGGIEIQGRVFTVNNNTMTLLNATGFGIATGGDATHASGDGTINGNTLNCAGGNGIDLDPAGLHTPTANVTVNGNVVLGATNGIATDAAGSYIDIIGNTFTTCGQSQAGTLNYTIHMRDNLPFSVSNSPNGRMHNVAQSIVSASHLTMPNSNTAEVTGANTVDLIESTGWYNGDIITLYFTDTLTVSSGKPASGNFKTIKLDGGADFAATPFDTLTLLWNSSTWEQISSSHNA